MIRAVLSEDNINEGMEIQLERGKSLGQTSVSGCHKTLGWGRGGRAWTKRAVAVGVEQMNSSRYGNILTYRMQKLQARGLASQLPIKRGFLENHSTICHFSLIHLILMKSSIKY